MRFDKTRRLFADDDAAPRDRQRRPGHVLDMPLVAGVCRRYHGCRMAVRYYGVLAVHVVDVDDAPQRTSYADDIAFMIPLRSCLLTNDIPHAAT
jgi:hypothetical protein